MPTRGKYAAFRALDPFFEIVLKGLAGRVDGDHFFDIMADDLVFESRYDLPGWPRMIRGPAALMNALSGYGENIKLLSSDGLIVHRCEDPRVVIIEYEVHGKVVATGIPYDNRLISVITIENRKISHWRDYMDSLSPWRALNEAPR